MTTERLRYEPLVRLASGGMASVHVGTFRSQLAFRRLVAIKRPHPHLLEDPDLRAALLLEARLASRIHHANVVEVRDVEILHASRESQESLQLVMDYVEGASLGELILAGAKPDGGPRIPVGVAVRIALDACAGLHAAHELRDEAGALLGLVHRDVSPQNILVGLDGVARVADFGLAKESVSTLPRTATGVLRGKIGYLAPEYVRGRPVDRRVDVFAMGVVLWEALTHKRLFRGSNEAEALERVLREEAPPVSAFAPDTGTALDAVLARALVKDPDERWASARELGEALEASARSAGLVATHAEVAEAVEAAVGDALRERRERVREALARMATEPESANDDEPAAPRAVEIAKPSSSPDLSAEVVAPPRSSRRPIAIGIGAFVATVGLGAAALMRREPVVVPSPVSASTQEIPAFATTIATSSAPPTTPSTSSSPGTPVTSSPSPPASPASTSSAPASSPSTPPSSKRPAKPLPPNPYR